MNATLALYAVVAAVTAVVAAGRLADRRVSAWRPKPSEYAEAGVGGLLIGLGWPAVFVVIALGWAGEALFARRSR